jgi:hypothetical protein
MGYVVLSLAQALAPEFVERDLFRWILWPGFAGELGLCLWLLVKGVNLQKWEETAHR